MEEEASARTKLPSPPKPNSSPFHILHAKIPSPKLALILSPLSEHSDTPGSLVSKLHFHTVIFFQPELSYAKRAAPQSCHPKHLCHSCSPLYMGCHCHSFHFFIGWKHQLTHMAICTLFSILFTTCDLMKGNVEDADAKTHNSSHW